MTLFDTVCALHSTHPHFSFADAKGRRDASADMLMAASCALPKPANLRGDKERYRAASSAGRHALARAPSAWPMGASVPMYDISSTVTWRRR